MPHLLQIFVEAYLWWITKISGQSDEYLSLPPQLIFHFLLWSTLFMLSCVGTITAFRVIAFTGEYSKTQATLRIPTNRTRCILVYGTSPWNSNLIFQMMFIQIQKTFVLFVLSMRVQILQKDLALTLYPWLSIIHAKLIRNTWSGLIPVSYTLIYAISHGESHLLLFVSFFLVD